MTSLTFPNFPLYTSLKQTVTSTEPLSDSDKAFLCNSIKNDEVLYALIKAYSLDIDINNLNTNSLYDAKQLKSGLKFTLNNLPVQLQNILLTFVKQMINNNT